MVNQETSRQKAIKRLCPLRATLDLSATWPMAEVHTCRSLVHLLSAAARTSDKVFIKVFFQESEGLHSTIKSLNFLGANRELFSHRVKRLRSAARQFSVYFAGSGNPFGIIPVQAGQMPENITGCRGIA